MRDQYPVYAGVNSAYKVLQETDEMEAKGRTEAQIKARVKKLGLTMSQTPVEGTSGTDSDDAEVGLSHSHNKADGRQDHHGKNDASPPSPERVRKVVRKSQVDSGDEGLFSCSDEVSR